MTCGTAWDRRSLQGLRGAKRPGVSGWLSPPVEKLTSDRSQQPWAQRKPGAPTTPSCEPGSAPTYRATAEPGVVPRQSQGCVGPCLDLSVPTEPRWHPVMGPCRDSHLQLGVLCLPAIPRAPSQLLSLFFGESFAASAVQTPALPLGLARQVLCTAGLLPAPARTKLSSCKYISGSGLSRD